MLLILLVIMWRDKSLELSMTRKFRVAVLSCIACLVVDIISVVAIVYASKGMFPRPATLFICKAYLVLLINVGYRGFLYAATEFFGENTHTFIRRAYRAIFFIGAVAIAVLPIDYYVNGRTVYSFGPSTMAAYVFAFISFISTIIIAFVDKEGTSKRRRRIILLWQICWLAAALLQFVKADLLVVSFAAATGILLIYAELENPNEQIDRTTGQFNYSALHSYMADLYSRHKPFSAMHVAVDYGAGDFDLQLQQNALRRIANFLDEKDAYVFRESDNDFIVIYENENAMEMGYERADAELKKISDLPISFSYTLIPDDSIFKTADEFLQFQHYNIRNMSSDNKIVAGSEQAEEMRTYLRIRDQISWALANNAVEVYYQPIYEVETKSFTVAEALLRIKDSEGKLIMPGDFIPIAEESGLIVPLGTEVFRQVCELLSKGEVQKLGVRAISVNLSMAQFNEDEPAAFIQRIASEYSIDPAWIHFEITETADPSTRQIILKNMEKLIDSGYHFALDDFGTGRSNLDYFVVMPVNIIKFDYKFTHWFFESDRSREVTLGLIEMIRRMGLPIVMEGVETKEELDTMIEIGASYIQGFYFSRPLPKDEYITFLEERK
jgi:EAL domain-containing protein (putative c-di-GMP-specific phosphodiesterase class I)